MKCKSLGRREEGTGSTKESYVEVVTFSDEEDTRPSIPLIK